MMMKFKYLALALFYALGFCMPLAAQSKADIAAYEAAVKKLYMAHLAISSLYVDSVDTNKLTEDAIVGMLKELDPHSAYSNAKETKLMNEPLQGNFEGIGVQYNMLEDTLFVIQPVSKGPSEKAGILAGDRIVMVNDTAIAGVKMSREEIMRRLKGPKGSIVHLGVLRNGLNEMLYFDVKRDKIPMVSVDAVYMLTKKTGLIRISNFGAKTHEEVLDAIQTLKKQGMKNLVLDLQQNGGGYLGAAIDIANEFLHVNDLIVYTKGRTLPHIRKYKATGKGAFKEGNLAVLVDEYSASAAEIVTGAIQDHDRGVVIGRRTFGKGLVQRPLDLPDGSSMRLTIARYYTPAGRCIQKPYQNGNKQSYNMDVINRYNRGELIHADSIHFPDSLKFKTLKKGRTVYGGGGIMPDYFIPLDTAKYTKYYRELTAKGVIISTTLKISDRYRNEIKATYPTFKEFLAKYQVGEKEMELLKNEAEKKSVRPKDDAENEKTWPLLKQQIKALLARDFWDMSEYFEVIYQDNDAILKAVELLEQRKG